MKQKPGVMLYFALWGSLQQLNDKELAATFRGLMDYGMTGQRPSLPGKAAILWPFLECQLLADDERYYERKAHGAYGVYVREQKRKGQEYLSYQDWVAQKEDPEASVVCI